MKILFLLLSFGILSNQVFCQRVELSKTFYPLEVISQNDTQNPVLIAAESSNAGLATIALNCNNSTATTLYSIWRGNSTSTNFGYDQSLNNLVIQAYNPTFKAIRINAANNFVAINTATISPTLAQLEVRGTTIFGSNGTVINSITKRTITLDIPTISAGQTTTLTFLLISVAPLGSVVSISPDAGLDSKLVIDYARVSASGVVDVVITNISPTNAVDPPAMNFHITVIN
jgi:hypothetical protein